MRLADGRPLVIAHRGASAYAPEHTFAAWDLALDMGADYIEQDLQMTSDGELIVLHDDTLDRTLRGEGCTGRASHRSLELIRRCDAGSWFNAARPEHADARFAMQRVASLAEVLDRYSDRARFYIETKNPEEAPGMEERLVELLQERSLLGTSDGNLAAVIVQSFSTASLQEMAALAPAIPRVLLLDRMSPDELLARIASAPAHADGLGPNFRSVSAAVVHAARSRNLALHPWTVNDDIDLRRMLHLGVEGVFTDRPDRLRHWIEQR